TRCPPFRAFKVASTSGGGGFWGGLLQLAKQNSHCGSIHFTIKYEFQSQTLVVQIIEAKDLLAKDWTGTSDPYVKLYLLPDTKKKLKTKTIMKNLNPTWSETLKFQGYPYDKIQKRTLHIKVMDYDKMSSDDPIGEVNIPLCDIDLNLHHNLWRDLNPISKEKMKRGEILMTLAYNPVTGILSSTVVKCKDLKPMDLSGYSDPYVKIYLMYENRRVEKVKTTCKPVTLNPTFDESFTFRVPPNKMDDTHLVITVMDRDQFKWNEKIGSVILGKKSGQNEMDHWREMISKRRQPITKWHFLKSDSSDV
ncbi:synaptotagmin-7-like, partial [Convolutriloba macropyga]|uniref:synaptotagmin-7-like n=1 Tax=Convolutriloba macropyga TaxID=536237 RepID=UPI003F526D87